MEKKIRKTRECDKEYDCFNGEFCEAFRSTEEFSSLRFKE